MKVLDLFSGAGGFSLGFKLAGYDVVGCVEWDKDAMHTHQTNFGVGKDILGDITKVTDEEIQEMFGEEGIDVIIAGPSCQSFSNANRMEDPNSQKAKERNRLFFEVLRIASIIRPKAIVIENVPQILTRDKGFAKEEIHRYLGELGYETVSKVLVSSDYGVPENRKRAIFVALKGEEFDFSDIKKEEKVTVYDALSGLYGLTEEESDYIHVATTPYEKYLRDGSQKITQHIIKEHNEDYKHRISYIPQGGNWEDIPKSEYRGVSLRKGVTHSNRYRRLDENGQSPTITTKKDLIHPLENREISIREAARIQSFPDWFKFEGSKTKKAMQIGNAVPPLMARSIAEALKEKIR